jgi:hypothetical protein
MKQFINIKTLIMKIKIMLLAITAFFATAIYAQDTSTMKRSPSSTKHTWKHTHNNNSNSGVNAPGTTNGTAVPGTGTYNNGSNPATSGVPNPGSSVPPMPNSTTTPGAPTGTGTGTVTPSKPQ